MPFFREFRDLGDFAKITGREYIFHTPVTRYSLFVLKVSLNTNKTRICAAEMAVRYAALTACRKVHVCHCNR